MLQDISDKVKRAIAGGSPWSRFQAAKPTAKYYAQWGKGDRFVEIVYQNSTVQ